METVRRGTRPLAVAEDRRWGLVRWRPPGIIISRHRLHDPMAALDRPTSLRRVGTTKWTCVTWLLEPIRPDLARPGPAWPDSRNRALYRMPLGLSAICLSIARWRIRCTGVASGTPRISGEIRARTPRRLREPEEGEKTIAVRTFENRAGRLDRRICTTSFIHSHTHGFSRRPPTLVFLRRMTSVFFTLHALPVIAAKR